jgi:hypothetical protein
LQLSCFSHLIHYGYSIGTAEYQSVPQFFVWRTRDFVHMGSLARWVDQHLYQLASPAAEHALSYSTRGLL